MVSSEQPSGPTVTVRPSASISSREMRLSAAVPQATEWEPQALLATMPPMVQREWVEGSGP